MMEKLSLDKGWKMHEAPLFWDKTYLPAVKRMSDNWFECDLPVDVRMPLIQYGVIKEPVEETNYTDSIWIENRTWWFIKSFELDRIDREVIELVIEAIDTDSDIFVNGQYIGSHCDLHYPYVANIKEYVNVGANELAVRVTTGLEKITGSNVEELFGAVCVDTPVEINPKFTRGDKRHVFVRRAQYNVGMDWDPRITTCGITRSAYIKCYDQAVIREVGVATLVAAADARLKLTLNLENLNVFSTRECETEIQISYDGVVCAAKKISRQLLLSGYNYYDYEFDIKDARLWWPNGYGGQPLYDVNVKIRCNDVEIEYPPFKYGIRKIELDTSVIAGIDRYFTFIINGVRIFCKGGNWIPADSLYARVSDEKYQTLIREAAAANFNMLRVWGGGLFEKDIFYQLCDQYGILLWHDFMFACAAYPDHHEWFRQEVRREFDYQTIRLRNYACIALWSGNNENHGYIKDRAGDKVRYEKQFGLYTANYIAKEVIRKNCPGIPYWASSPYGGQNPNSLEIGDIHKWPDCMMNPVMAHRIEPKRYDENNGKFVSEYGYVGPCCKKTMTDYFAGKEIVPGSETWQLHTNTYEKDTVFAGIEKHYDVKAAELSLDDYIQYGGVTQGLMLGYSLEGIRFSEDCSGGLFWMYNDTWGEIGWTIIDYYLRRKISFYGVKRAFAPVKVTMRVKNGSVIIQGLNDTPEDIAFAAEYGYVSFDGKVRKTKKIELDLKARSRKYVFREALPEEDYFTGSIVLIPGKSEVDSVMLRIHDMKQLIYGKSAIKVLSDKHSGGDRVITVTAAGFAHCVHVEGEYSCSDNYFDIIPGEEKTFTVKGAGAANLVVKSVR